MRSHLLVSMLLAACAGTVRPVPRAPVPLGPPSEPVAVEIGARAAADRSPPAPVVDAPMAATSSVTWRTVTVLPEPEPEPVVAPVAAVATPAAPAYVYVEPGWRSARRHDRSIAVAALVGFGVGSLLGHHHHGVWFGHRHWHWR